MPPSAPMSPNTSSRRLGTPGTPDTTRVDTDISSVIALLGHEWDIDLRARQDAYHSPPSLERICMSKLRHIAWHSSITPIYMDFQNRAEQMYSGWVQKPKAERGVIPEATNRAHRISSSEKEQLLKVLQSLLEQESDKILRTPKSHHSGRNSRNTSFNANHEPLNDSPVPFSLRRASGDSKRSRDESEVEKATMKKPRKPGSTSRAKYGKSASFTEMAPPTRGRPEQYEPMSRSANTSFASINSSVFDRQGLTQRGTQETAPDDEPWVKPQDVAEAFMNPQAKSSDYGSSSYDFDAIPDEFIHPDKADAIETKLVDQSQDEVHTEQADPQLPQVPLDFAIDGDPSHVPAEEQLREMLQSTFGTKRLSLVDRSFPFPVFYEITRVFLHANVPICDVYFPISVNFSSYDNLWEFLKELPVLKGKEFPAKSSSAAWNASLNGFEHGFAGVVFAGSLTYNLEKSSDQLFRFRLQPMVLDTSHRLGRRLGSDRFLELDIPQLGGYIGQGQEVPKILKVFGERGRLIIIEWLIDTAHKFLGRHWRPFFVKKKEKNNRGKGAASKTSSDPTAYRVSLFAVDGVGFVRSLDPIREPPGPARYCMKLDDLFNIVRPTRKNKNQPYLKLFARTSLALSRTFSTVTLERSQIRECPDIMVDGKEMTDGAGRISLSLAYKVTQLLGLSYLPSAFQGRIGESKGLWIVNYEDRSGEDWIEVYASQQKWKRSTKVNGESDDPSHRTFEVLTFSKPLKSADLNSQFLAVLIDRAKDPKEMKRAISNLLQEWLARELSSLHTAKDSPRLLRKWVRETGSEVSGRLREGFVTYRAGLPTTVAETVTFLLDAGFEIHSSKFLQSNVSSLFLNRTKDLKTKLHIAISKSTYAFMVPDFWGVLEENEVYMDFSSFIDDDTGFSGTVLNGEMVLVARSPTHFPSDIQKVKCVAKAPLMGLKDVIVFSVKGNSSLASKLSGGDYDGDIAWVCWEPPLVQNFITADVPECPDLVKEGYIKKDSTTYQELVEGQPDQTCLFLKRSFAFNMRPSLLGICTKWKEMLCYTQNSVSTRESIMLSTLLSALVDMEKQGYMFTEDDWSRFKTDAIKVVPRQPPYMKDEFDRRSKHIIDHLKCLAYDVIEKSKTELFQSLPKSPPGDEDLVAYYKFAKHKAEDNEEWRSLLRDLKLDLDAVIDAWSSYWAQRRSKRTGEEKSDFDPILDKCFEQYVAIQPHADTTLTQALLSDVRRDPGASEWALLKASAIFSSKRTSNSNFPWMVAGRQLARLKAIYRGGPHPHTVVPGMYAILKPDASFVKKVMAGKIEPALIDQSDGILNAGY